MGKETSNKAILDVVKQNIKIYDDNVKNFNKIIIKKMAKTFNIKNCIKENQ